MNDAYTKVLIDTFDELSETYTNNFTVDPEERVKIQSLVNLWKIKHGSNALEVGGGTGDLTPFLLEKICPIGKLSFLDISPKMVEKAREDYVNIITLILLLGTFIPRPLLTNLIQLLYSTHFPTLKIRK